MHKVVINKNKCIACGKCVQLCPKKILYINENSKICKVSDESKCDGLRGCERVCPEDAIEISVNNNKKTSGKGGKNMTIRIVAGIIIGALLGTAAGYLLKCAGGSCPLTCNPWVGAITGALVGLMISAG